jgi:hypothetical protein
MFDAASARGGLLLLALALACRRGPAKAREELAAVLDAESLASAPVRPPPEGGLVASLPVVRLPPAAPSEQAAVEPIGGRWVSCYANFRATSAPERDVARLAEACGPSNGMVAVAPIAAGDATDAAEDHGFEARAGDCFRIFAVADAFVADLGVEVINPLGHAVTWDRNGDRWPILNPDGPFCLFEGGTYTVRVRALQGKGRYALQIWRLPDP